MENTIRNRVAESSIITIDIKEFYPKSNEYVVFDMADFLFERLILKEKDFRQKLKDLDYGIYQNKYAGIYCSEDVIIPQWAYLLAAVHLYPFAKKIFYADKKRLVQEILKDKIITMDLEYTRDKPVVIKGCSDVDIDIEVYILLVNRLMQTAKSIMYGEPCSNVPLFKRK